MVLFSIISLCCLSAFVCTYNESIKLVILMIELNTRISLFFEIQFNSFYLMNNSILQYISYNIIIFSYAFFDLVLFHFRPYLLVFIPIFFCILLRGFNNMILLYGVVICYSTFDTVSKKLLSLNWIPISYTFLFYEIPQNVSVEIYLWTWSKEKKSTCLSIGLGF